MLRRIVVTKPFEELNAAYRSRSFGLAAARLKKVARVAGMEFDESHHPVRLPTGRLSFLLKPQRALGFDYAALTSQLEARNVPDRPTYAMRVMFTDRDAIERLKRNRADTVVGVYADPVIAPVDPYCGAGAVGALQDVATRLKALQDAGLSGKGVRVAIVDTGIDGSQVPVVGGWSPVDGYVPGSAQPNHGTMTAFDSRIGAPDAQILDYALLQSKGGSWSAFLSDAITAFSRLVEIAQDRKGPLVVSNSWGLYDRSEDEPIGAPGNYSANPEHPFNQITGSLVASGAEVCFAAGNCGDPCPDQRCGTSDVGPGASIHGANSHPDVVTVAAVTVNGDRLGYSSQGPGGLAQRKPDVAGFSHFVGSGVYEVDSGTSAACPVVAGLIAALRQGADVATVSPLAMKAILQRTAQNTEPGGWNRDLGYGIVDAGAAVQALGLGSVAPVTATSLPLKRAATPIALGPVQHSTVATAAASGRARRQSKGRSGPT